MAKEPRGKKWGPRLFPIMFENISAVFDWELRLVISVAWFTESSPSMVIGQLFMKLAPMVTTRLGVRIESTEGSSLVLVKRSAKRFMMFACFKP